MKKSFANAITLYLSFLLPFSLAMPFVPLFIVSNLGLSLFQALLLYAVTFLGVVALLFLVKAVDSRVAFVCSGLAFFLHFLLLAFFPSWLGLVAAFFLFGFLIVFFWGVYNCIFFSLPTSQGNATSSAVYFLVPKLLAIVLPLAGGLAAIYFGLSALFAIAALLSLGLSLAGLLLPSRKFDFSLGKSLENAKGFRTLVFFEGWISASGFFLIPLASVYFFPKPLDLGLFTAVFSLSSLAAMFFLAKYSDSNKTRKKYVFPLLALLLLSIALASMAKNPFEWAAASLAFGFLFTLANPLFLAVVLDKKAKIDSTMASRELFLNLGRLSCAVTSLGLLLAFQSNSALIVLPSAFGILFYSIVLHTKKWVL